MFVVARRKGQRLLIGTDIEVVVKELSRSTVKLGIVAPAHRQILRGELYDAIETANREAAQADLSLSGSVPVPSPTAECSKASASPKQIVNALAVVAVRIPTPGSSPTRSGE